MSRGPSSAPSRAAATHADVLAVVAARLRLGDAAREVDREPDARAPPKTAEVRRAGVAGAGVFPLPDIAAHVEEALETADAAGQARDRKDGSARVVHAVASRRAVSVSIRVDERTRLRARVEPLACPGILEVGVAEASSTDRATKPFARPGAVHVGVAPVGLRDRHAVVSRGIVRS